MGRITNTENETVRLITSLENPDPKMVLALNRAHQGIESMHRDKDVTLGEDQYTNRLDHAPRNIFTILSAARTVLKGIHKSTTRAIEMAQDDRSKVISILACAQLRGNCQKLLASASSYFRVKRRKSGFGVLCRELPVAF